MWGGLLVPPDIRSVKIPFELLISEVRSLEDLEQVFCDMKARKVIKVAMIPHAPGAPGAENESF
ncbi:hypothetical protein A2T98_05745 [Nodularia spumigena CENA596]|uniref:Alcohol dehydrogenase n=1 Tax=Nodularia spumigena CENA596 TaxID=1819295 RepID=A0A166K9N8_NODSP|nr:hypothetical protein A2T98_05745 [Nodularia spumigena CENA596]